MFRLDRADRPRNETSARLVKLGFPKRVAMTPTVAELLARKQKLLERLQEEPRLNEQDEIARLLAGIDAVLNRIDAPPIERRAMRH
jgi:hypothetical protein